MDIDKIKIMYGIEHKSAKDIANYYGNTVWQVYRFMKKHGFDRRLSSETNHLKFLKSPLSFSVKNNLTQEDRKLWLGGILLYWAEGSKAGNCVVDFANCDEKMILIFLKMLRIIYGISEEKLRVFIYCHANQVQSELISHWSSLLNIPKSQFTMPYVRKDFDINKSDKMKWGLVHIRYADVRLMEKIKQDIAKIASSLLPESCSGQSLDTVNVAPYGYVGSNPTSGTIF